MVSEHTDFYKSVISRHGRQGKDWLDQLFNLVELCAKKWNLTQLIPVANLTYNYVLSALENGKPVILKLRYITHDRVLFDREIDSLKATCNFGAVKLLAYDNELGALLLERIIPGDMLEALVRDEDSKATSYAAQLLSLLHTVPLVSSEKYSHLQDVIPFFEHNFEALLPFTGKARLLRDLLLIQEDFKNKVLLHGDFHHGNILLGDAGIYYAIDPEGMIGDPGYDMAVFIRNPLKELISMVNGKEVVLNRIKIFADFFGYDQKRLLSWVYLQTFTSAYWSLEDGENIQRHVAFLALLDAVKI